MRYDRDITPDGYKLICFHHAGGGASAFVEWQSCVKPGIEVIPVQLPGRENRMREGFLHSCGEAAEIVAAELSDHLQSHNFSVFGHSMGGIIAFEAAKCFEKAGLQPDMCFISATSITEKKEFIPTEKLSDDEFFERVALYGALDKESEILQYPEFKEIFLKILRADFEMVEGYKDDGAVIKCPITAMCGRSDPMETIEMMKSWEKHTSGAFSVSEYDGGHFYLSESREKVCADISDIIRRCRDGG